MTWWQEYSGYSNEKVNSPTIIATAMLILTGILFLLAIILICYHCFYHGKGIDGDTVKLILGLIVGGSGAGGLGAYFTKTAITTASSAITTTTTKEESSSGNRPKAKPKTDEEGEV